MNARRYASVIRLRPETVDEYVHLHAAVWPSVLKTIADVGIRNFSIFLRDGMLFSYFEYVGDDFDSDMAKMAADNETRRWWSYTDPCQQPLETVETGQWWAPALEVFHSD